jgi:uncharacterized protein (DUF1330 family)
MEVQFVKTNYKIILGMLIGSVIGAAGISAIHAQQTKVLPAYVIAEVEVTDPATFKEYADKTPGTMEPFNGHYIVRGGKNLSLEGDAPKRFVVAQFDSFEKAKAWEDSPAYSAIRPIRQKSAKSRIFIVEGVAPQQ